VNEVDFVSIPITKALVGAARSKCTNVKFNRHTSRAGGGGQLTGNLGELAFKYWLRDQCFFDYECVAEQKKFHDFIIAGSKIDVKSKERTVAPRANHQCHVEERIKDEDCDYYIMASVRIPKGEVDPSSVHLLGWIKKAVFWGLPRDDDSKKDTMVSHKVFHSRLEPMSSLISEVQKVCRR